MSVIFIDGFDKYGPTGTKSPAVGTSLTQGEWTSSGVTATIVAPLSSSGYALSINGSTSANHLNKTLPASVSRLIGGMRFNSPLGGNNFTIGFVDSTTVQCSLAVATTGLIEIDQGLNSTLLQRSVVGVTANTTHFLEWDITIGTSGAWTVWLDGAQILSGLGNTKQSANSTLNVFALYPSSIGGSQTVIVDDLYLFNSAGSTNNAALLSNPQVETKFPAADHQAQFTAAAYTLGFAYRTSTGTAGIAVNQLIVQPATPIVNATLNGLELEINATGTGQFIPVVYSDNAGVPGTLLAQGPAVTAGATGFVAAPLTSGLAITAGTQYWIGFLYGTATVTIQLSGLAATGRSVSQSFAGGPPSTAPAMTGGQGWASLYGACTNPAHNFASELSVAPVGSASFIASATAGNNDLYQFPAPNVGDVSIYAVAVKGHAELSTTGSRNISMRTLSGATNSSGSLGSVALTTSYLWYDSYFEVDPNTSLPWTATTVAAAFFGPRLDT